MGASSPIHEDMGASSLVHEDMGASSPPRVQKKNCSQDDTKEEEDWMNDALVFV
jgi:hypothetical protein